MVGEREMREGGAGEEGGCELEGGGCWCILFEVCEVSVVFVFSGLVVGRVSKVSGRSSKMSLVLGKR